MSIILISILTILLLSRVLQRRFSIPLPIGIMSLTLITYTYMPELINLSAHEKFDEILLLLLPLILLPDAMNFRLRDLKKHGIAIFYLSFVAVVLSIIAGIVLNFASVHDYTFTVGMLISLFAMVLATDAVSVSSIFSQFELPHSLKVLTEGESLFNDATAMIAFLFIGLPLMGGAEITAVDVSFILVKVLAGSIVIGFIVGYIAKIILGWLHTVVDEFIVILLAGYAAFVIAELHAIHVSGILSLIVAIMTLQFYINRDLSRFSEDEEIVSDDTQRRLSSRERLITTKARIDANKQSIAFFALFANALLFVTLAELIELEKLFNYTYEIIGLFLVTTVIRALMMLKFSFISRASNRITNVNYRWWAVLTLSGIKGGLSIIMVHHLPESFIYKEMFTQVVMGVILLSIFVYAIGLIAVIGYYKEAFKKDIELENATH
ncbi:cation:proton antiporter [Sulfurimonas sp. HSL3-7]|uniref:cation:proton antiporter domain-containing protein n=1 Tax=Sulfonitrofixus jiaomeiensis TaxID=3131938 RepID=UPI0031F82A15